MLIEGILLWRATHPRHPAGQPLWARYRISVVLISFDDITIRDTEIFTFNRLQWEFIALNAYTVVMTALATARMRDIRFASPFSGSRCCGSR